MSQKPRDLSTLTDLLRSVEFHTRPLNNIPHNPSGPVLLSFVLPRQFITLKRNRSAADIREFGSGMVGERGIIDCVMFEARRVRLSEVL
ncbi:hypothetical protein RSOLAG22IIIB_06101 [Rhizoctonia solani]|uniref:Uncharacterized protein n=1 Tax=Rhizoctonia solani TaxID=456999 RepID=A0A0K6GBW2_9AGAM|nr:hypothetical protein RSOLAG22IIIB_06101 [Rhizoctonia solani]